MKYRHGREGSTIVTIQSLVFMFKKFMMKISLDFASTTQGKYENLILYIIAETFKEVLPR